MYTIDGIIFQGTGTFSWLNINFTYNENEIHNIVLLAKLNEALLIGVTKK